MAGVIRTRHALTPEERDFVKMMAAGLPRATAYGRAFMKTRVRKGREIRFDIEFDEEKGAEVEKEVSSKEVDRRASAYAKQPHIVAYLEELSENAGDQARSVLMEDVVLEGDSKAALKLLEHEEKLRFRDAVERWGEVLVACGAEVVVDVPGGGEIAVPMGEMFPKWKGADVPDEVLEKTANTLDQIRWRRDRIRTGQPVDYTAWSFGDGFAGRGAEVGD